MFKKAQPVWLNEKHNEMNVLLGFIAKVNCEKGNKLSIRISAKECYKLYINGEFHLSGPARTAKGYSRVDCFELDNVKSGQNTLFFLVAGYNVNSFQYENDKAFLQFEVYADNNIVYYSKEGDLFYEIPWHLQKVIRYSFQRTFTEVWKVDHELEGLFSGDGGAGYKADVQEPRRSLKRSSLIPRYEKISGSGIVEGSFKFDCNRSTYYPDGPNFYKERDSFKCYKLNEISVHLGDEISKLHSCEFLTCYGDTNLEAGYFRIYDLLKNKTGYIGVNVVVNVHTEIYITFDEILTNNDVDAFRLSCINAIKCYLEPGEYNFESFEPYTMRYLKVCCLTGEINIKRLYVREVANPEINNISFMCSNNSLNKIFDAAVETYSQNAVDIFMDCPSRERAGWLCDSYFTGQIEKLITGENKIEHDFLENFLLLDNHDHLPEEMLPMCYPADHHDGTFIPNWAMWFIVELYDYFQRSGDKQLVCKFKNKVYILLDYFGRFENEFGLLEKLDGWVFIEWSSAANFTQDVNYPTNMLYSGMLKKAGSLYDDISLINKSNLIREEIQRQSYNGEFFVDNSVRVNGILTPTTNISEVCQYYAFYFGIATPETHKALWNHVINDFGPKRLKKNNFEKVYMANAFIGNYLRLDILCRNGFGNQAVAEMESYFGYMADETGTLWENDGAYASCNHGFASYVIKWLMSEVAGFKGESEVGNYIVEPPSSISGLDWCEARLGIGEGKYLNIKWSIKDNCLLKEVNIT